MILSAEAVGTVLMTLVMLRVAQRHPLREGMIAVSLVAIPIAALGLTPHLLVLVVAFFVAGAAVEVFGVGWSTALHEHVPLPVLSRVSSYDALGSFVAIPIGTFVYGWLAMTMDLSVLLVASAVGYAVIALSALASRSVRDLRRAEGGDPAAPQPAEGIAGPHVQAPVGTMATT